MVMSEVTPLSHLGLTITTQTLVHSPLKMFSKILILPSSILCVVKAWSRLMIMRMVWFEGRIGRLVTSIFWILFSHLNVMSI